MSQWPFENLRRPEQALRRPWHLVYSNDLFSETTASMVLKYHMQHDEAAELQNDKILPDRESKMAAVAKNS